MKRQRDPGYWGQSRVCANVEGNASGGQHACTATVEADLDRFRCDEPPGSHDQLGAAALVEIEMHGDETIDHSLLARQYLPHIGADRASGCAEPVGVVHKIGDFRTPDLVLAGQAVGVGTRATDELAFDDGGAAARFGHMPGKELTALPTAKDEQVELFCLEHEYHLLHACLVKKSGRNSGFVSARLSGVVRFWAAR